MHATIPLTSESCFVMCCEDTGEEYPIALCPNEVCAWTVSTALQKDNPNFEFTLVNADEATERGIKL